MKEDEVTWIEVASTIVGLIAIVLLTALVVRVFLKPRPADAAEPVTVTAQDVSLKVKGGDDYQCFRGHAANQYERDMMEQTLSNVWMPQLVKYERAMAHCTSLLSNIRSQLTVVRQRLNCVHQYDDIGGPPPKAWFVTQGGRHYQIEYYRMAAAHSCSLGSGAAPCGALLANNPDLLDLLDLHLETGDDGVVRCAEGATFTPPPDCNADSETAALGVSDGRMRYQPLSADDATLLGLAVTAHHGSMCGETPSGSVVEAQNAFIATALTIGEAHFRTPQPFKGGCDPLWSEAECCEWKELEHLHYAKWAAAVMDGDVALARCEGRFHADMHFCANLADPVIHFRPAPCTDPATYPDDTAPVTCAEYLAAMYPATSVQLEAP